MANTIPLIKVNQWLSEWDEVKWAVPLRRRKPIPHFYVGSMRAVDLKRLSAIYRRSVEGKEKRSDDAGIQRRHDERRSERIRQFVKYGYPYGELTQQQRASGEHESLRKPGWLPTGIVINILSQSDVRNDKHVHKDDLIGVATKNGRSELILPDRFESRNWRPKDTPPIEVIDGQHRLWSFESDDESADFEMPVIAFHELDISWQAYLFWSINISPVRINASLAFDMYPLLRMEDWLDKFEGHKIYKEARAQELVEAVWSHEDSPWHRRIDMLAEPGNPWVRQAAWVRTLVAAFFKQYDAKSMRGGLFGALRNNPDDIVPWTRSQQAAFLIFCGLSLRKEIDNQQPRWLKAISKARQLDAFDDIAKNGLFNNFSLLNSDQGIRALFLLTNDVLVTQANSLDIFQWKSTTDVSATSDASIKREIKELSKSKLGKVIAEMMEAIADFDWRSASSPDLTEAERLQKKVFRGSGGYVELKRLVALHLARRAKSKPLKDAAASCAKG